MKLLLSIIIAVHGLIHLMGFTRDSRYNDMGPAETSSPAASLSDNPF